MNYCRVLRNGAGIVFGQSVFHVGDLGTNVVFRSAKAHTFAERKTTLSVLVGERLPTPFALRATKPNPTVIVLPVLIPLRGTPSATLHMDTVPVTETRRTVI
jgi:hypothetical protein